MYKVNYFINLLASIIFKFFNLLLAKKWIRGYIPYSIVKNNGQNNTIQLKHFDHGKISIEGNSNEVIVLGQMGRCNIYIEGDNNKLLILPGTGIGNSTIYIRAKHGFVRIGNGTKIMSAKLVCQGDDNKLLVGENCLFSTDVDVWNSDTHSIYDMNGNFINYSLPIIIEDHVWLGKRVSVLKGVTIGKDSVIGMGAIITKDVPERSLVVGSPQHIVKENISWNINQPLSINDNLQ